MPKIATPQKSSRQEDMVNHDQSGSTERVRIISNQPSKMLITRGQHTKHSHSYFLFIRLSQILNDEEKKVERKHTLFLSYSFM